MLNRLANHQYQLDEAMVLHFAGYGKPDIVRDSIRDRVRELLTTARHFTDCWGGTVELPIRSITATEVRLQRGGVNENGLDMVLRSRHLPGMLQGCEAVVVLLATAGGAISEKAREATDPLEGFLLDALGSAMVVELMRALTRDVFDAARVRHYGTTLRTGPGYTGWRIEDQDALCTCFENETIPVSFVPGSMMNPQKTLLGLTGLKPNGKEAPEIEPCRVCDLTDCKMRLIEFRGLPDQRGRPRA